MKRTKKKENPSLRLGFYFGLLVIFIILVSVLFKAFDLVKKSKFDGKNNLTVAVLKQDSAEILSVSPREGTLKKLKIENIRDFNNLREQIMIGKKI